jgi:hypothetical protein
MPGEMLGEEKRKVTTYRLMKPEGGHNVEVTFRTEGPVLGIQMRNMGIYSSQVRTRSSFRQVVSRMLSIYVTSARPTSTSAVSHARIIPMACLDIAAWNSIRWAYTFSARVAEWHTRET